MTGSTTKTSPTQRKFTMTDVARCMLVTAASAPVAWLDASLLSHRTLSNHEQIGTIVFTVLLLGNAMRYSIRSWKWSAIFLSVLLLFPLVFDRRCLLLASLAIPMLTAVGLCWWMTRRWVLVAMASVGAGVAAVLGSSALLTPWPGSTDQLLVNAWAVQWSMRGEQERLFRTRGDWERAIGNANVKELETWAKRELQAVKATEQEARQKEHGDYLQDAITLYRRAAEQLRQTQELVVAVHLWESPCTPGDRKLMQQYEKAGLAQADAVAAQAAANRAADQIEAAAREYVQAAGLIKAACAAAANKAEQVNLARKTWDAALHDVDSKLMAKYANAEWTKAQSNAQEANSKKNAGDAESAVRLYDRAAEQLRQTQQLVLALQSWESTCTPSDHKLMKQYEKEALAQADARVARAVASRAADQIEAAASEYGEAAGLMKAARAAAANKAEQVNVARKTWDAALHDVDSELLAKYATAEFDRARSKAQEAASKDDKGDADSAVRLYDEAVKILQPTVDLGGGVTMKFVRIPAGEFLMGSRTGEQGHDADEAQHKVKLTKPFYMQTTLVTQAQWQAVMGNNPSHFHGDNLPVEEVSWNDAVAFCQRLSQKEGRRYRLPTEAEWEYACRAGTQTAYGGTGNLDEIGWYDGNSNHQTHPVAQKKPNAWNLYDMHGNVWQWCSDVYGLYAGDAVDPTGSNDGSSHVLRGGSWDSGPDVCRAASRYVSSPGRLDYGIGFRLCLDF